jgi:NADH-quinone oxidoreductase subunit N
MNQTAFVEAVTRIKGDAAAFLPEIVLSVVVCALLLYDVYAKKASHRGAAMLAAVGLCVAGVALLAQASGLVAGGRELFAIDASGRGMIRLDGYALFFKGLVLVAGLVTVPMALQARVFADRKMGEFYALLLGSVIGMFAMASATHLLMAYLGVEFASLCSYLLVAFVKRDMKGSEAGLKYVVYGSVASGLMIYGFSLLYGMTGSLHLSALAETFVATGLTNATLLVAGVLVFAGFAYKMAAFPMHFWCPDVYEGAPTPFTAFLSVASKAAGFALFVRFLLAFKSGFTVQFTGGLGEVAWPTLVGAVAAASMTIGNLAALAQTNVKRLLAYSSIAHAGYLLMGVSAMRPGEPSAQATGMLFYFVAYLFMNLGAFYVANAAESDPELKATTVDDYAALGRKAPFIGACMTLFLFSLIGIPPTAGFTGKFQLFKNVVERGDYWLAVVAGVNTAISMYYYAKLLKSMYFAEAKSEAPSRFSAASSAFVGVLAFPVLWLFVDSDRLVAMASRCGLGAG